MPRLIDRKHQALTMLRQGKSTQEIAAATGYREFSVYRIAQDNRLQAHRAPRPSRKDFSGRAIVTLRKRCRKLYPALLLHSPVLRAAELDKEAILHFTAEPGRIVITAAPPAPSGGATHA